MATLKEYFEKDFENCAKIFINVPVSDIIIRGAVCLDFAGHNSFISCYVDDNNFDEAFYDAVLEKLSDRVVNLDGEIGLPMARTFPGQMTISYADPVEILAKFHGEDTWTSSSNLESHGRLFIYSNTVPTLANLARLKEKASAMGFNLAFRSKFYQIEREKVEAPLAFISHDSRDKDLIARKIANNLQKMICPVWYDEFSLNVGDNLRERIEDGIQKCRKCILILSPNFVNNNGWTKLEYDSIFTRELLDRQSVILPVWSNIDAREIYKYSPSLANKFGLIWENLGEDVVSQKLFKAIVG